MNKTTAFSAESKKEGEDRNLSIPESPWSVSVSDILKRFSLSADKGLNHQQVTERRNRYGANRLRKHREKGIWEIVIEQLKSLIILLLAVAAIISFLFGEILEGWAIMVVILINTGIGFVTELRAIRSMEALFRLGRMTTRVRRDGEVREIDATELVPGDIVIIEGGDMITADLRVINSSKLQADESALTGESMPVGKHNRELGVETPLAERSCMLYKGTAITRGAAEGVVVAIGEQTELGQISLMVEDAEEKQTPLEERLDRLGYRLIGVTMFIALFVLISGVMGGKELFLMIETSIALAVATIPEGLPIVATIALAKGLQVMARKNALINRLSSVETLGATGIICTDKTGTLTENRMTVTGYYLPDTEITVRENDDRGSFFESGRGEVADPEKLMGLRLMLETGLLCNNASLSEQIGTGYGDPLEVALLEAARKADLDLREVVNRYPEAAEEAFDPEVKMMATWNEQEDNSYRVSVKGAPTAVLESCDRILTDGEPRPLKAEEREQWLQTNEDLAATGLRMLGMAYKQTKDTENEPYNNLVFIGLVSLLDPPRKDVKQAIERCHQAGIRVVMITGDQKQTARYIGEAVGLIEPGHGDVIEGTELPSREQLEADVTASRQVLESSLFARISPRQKLDLIGLYQHTGQIVAMTGDGVNDAPALKKADIGIAMGKSGTQVAREASDMVLTDDAFSTIVSAIGQGRIIFENIRRFIYYLMSCNVSEVLVVGVAALLNTPLPILPLQILFLNLVTDVFPALALGVGEKEEGMMERPPRDADEPILTNAHWLGIAGYGVVITASVLGVLYYGLAWAGLTDREAVTLSFLTLALSQLWHVFNMRGARSGWLDNTIVRNRWIWGALLLCLALILGAVYLPGLSDVMQIDPPDFKGWLVVMLASLVPLLVGQLAKMRIPHPVRVPLP